MCVNCSANNFCANCVDNFLPVNGTCYLCGVENCINCTNSTNLTCQACAAGYTLANNTCTFECNVSNCASCSIPDVCAVCNTNFTLFNSSCFANCGVTNCIDCSGTTCFQCITDYVLFGLVCQPLCNIENCATCAAGKWDVCEACATGFEVSTDGSRCVTCNNANCSSCRFNNFCGACATEVDFNFGYCFSCAVDNCIVCSVSSDRCTTCFDGYTLIATATGVADQCIVCNNPCATCNADGSCATCQAPYLFTSTSSPNCVLCDDPRCISCTDTGNSSCTTCSTGWVAINGVCQSCVAGCTTCSSIDTTICTVCATEYWVKTNNTCSLCSSDLKCKTCTYDSTSNVITCSTCSDGYWLDMTANACMACQPWCKTCLNATYCTATLSQYGVTLATTMVGMNMIAACDPGCLSCSTSNPQVCEVCFFGFYMVPSMTYCLPCTGICASCNSSAPATCYSCWADSYLNTSDNLCYKCDFPCSSCTISSTTCSSCAQGYVFITSSNTCVIETSVSNTIANCANQESVTTNSSSTTCSLCLQGFA